MLHISPHFTPVASLAGGLLIGGAATVHLACNGRLTGLSSIVKGAVLKGEGFEWKSIFLGGLGLGATLWEVFQPAAYGPVIKASPSESVLVPGLAGILVGCGTTLANGCTSGHGVCGLPRLSVRSLAAVGTFMGTGIITAVAASKTDTFGLASMLHASTERSNIISTVYAAGMLALPAWALLKFQRRCSEEIAATKDAQAFSKEPLIVPPSSSTQNEDTWQSLLAAFSSGLVFSAGLGLSGMTNPGKVKDFLNVAGEWDPSLALVMGGAVGLCLGTFHLIGKWGKPLLREDFAAPLKSSKDNVIDGKLLLGSAIFGVGWGLSGICPGPGFMGLATGTTQYLTWQVASICGSALAMRLTE